MSMEYDRQSANYHPSIWGDFFITFTCDKQIIHAWSEKAEILKEKVREMLKDEFNRKQLSEKLSMIEAIQRLGIEYHFEEEIDKCLQQIFKHYSTDIIKEDHELLTVALLFRLLRQHGYHVSCDIFSKFKDNKGSFNETLEGDIIGLLSLYEATYLRLRGETILDEAISFTKTALEAKLSAVEPHLAEHIVRALKRPVRKSHPRLAVREYISFYQQYKLNDEILLKLAKLDFNILQSQHQLELQTISRWWKEIEVEKTLPFARDRIAECFFWMLGVYYERRYALARKFSTKVIAVASIIDDIYDVYGSYAELELFTEAIQRWVLDAMSGLPDCMKIAFLAIKAVYSEMEEEIADEGRSYAIYYAEEAVKKSTNAFLEEAKWLLENKMPSVEEYMKTALVSTCYLWFTAVSFVGMGQVAKKEDFDWLFSEPPILRAICVICRLMGDIVSHQFERERKHIPSAVECYMNQHKVTENEAYDEFNNQVEDAWMDINEAFLNNPQALPIPLLTRMLNLARVMDLLYKEKDGYTHSQDTTKHYIASLLVDPIEM